MSSTETSGGVSRSNICEQVGVRSLRTPVRHKIIEGGRPPSRNAQLCAQFNNDAPGPDFDLPVSLSGLRFPTLTRPRRRPGPSLVMRQPGDTYDAGSGQRSLTQGRNTLRLRAQEFCHCAYPPQFSRRLLLVPRPHNDFLVSEVGYTFSEYTLSFCSLSPRSRPQTIAARSVLRCTC